MNGVEIKVGILSTSTTNRNHLRALLKSQGAAVVCSSDIRGFVHPEINPPNVLLVHLDDADDSAFDALDDISTNSPVPVLINEGANVPDSSSPEALSMSSALIRKLRDAVAKRAQQQKAKPELVAVAAPQSKLSVDKSRSEPTGPVSVPVRKTAKAAQPKKNSEASNVKKTGVTLGIISKSRTRCMAMAKLLPEFPRTSQHLFGPGFDPSRALGGSDILLIDRHNLGAEELPCFKKMTGQRAVPFVICNSSEMTVGGSASKTWSLTVFKQLRTAYQQHAANKKQETADTAKPKPATKPVAAATAPATDKKPQTSNLRDMFQDMPWDLDNQQVGEILNQLPAKDRSAPKKAKPKTSAADDFTFDFSQLDVLASGASEDFSGDLLSDEEALRLAGMANDGYDELHYQPFDESSDFNSDDLPDITQFITGPDGEFGLHNPYHMEDRGKQSQIKSWFGGLLSVLQKKNRG